MIKMMKNIRKNIIIGMISMFFILSIINVEASHLNELNLDFVDGFKNDEYENIYSNQNYSIGFLNTNDSCGFFINSLNIITEIQIDIFIITENDETKYFKSVFNNEEISYMNEMNETIYEMRYYCEIAIDLAHLSMIDKNIIFRMNSENPIQISFTPNFLQIPESDNKELWFKIAWIFSLILSISTLIIVRFWMLSKKPHVYAREKNEYNLKYLGRYTDQLYDEKIRKYRLYFKNKDGITEIFSNMGWNDLEKYGLNIENFLVSSVSAFHMLLPHIIIDSLKISTELDIKTYDFDKKSIQYKIYRFLSFLPLKSFVFNLFKKCKIESKNNVSEIPILILEYSRDSIEYLFDISYEIQEENKKTGKNEWIAKNEQKINYTKIISLKESGIRKLKIGFNSADIYEFRSVKEALDNRDSKEEIKSKFLIKEMDLTNQIKTISSDNFEYLHIIQDLKSKFKQKLTESMQRFTRKYYEIDENIPDLLGTVFEQKRLGITGKEQYTEALIDLIDNPKVKEEKSKESQLIDTKFEDLEKKYVELQKSIKNKTLLGDL